MTHASLFSGIGGFDLAAEWMGWENLFYCEINEFSRKILNYYFPKSIAYEDIRKTNFTKWRGTVDVISGGFPCQPFSLDGKRKGADDDRYLWPEMLRAIREIQPSWVVGENVAGILTMVQPGTETSLGCEQSLFGEEDRERILVEQEYVVETVCRDLEREGYSIQPFVIPACAVGAPHRRDRVWFVANRADARDEGLQQEWENRIYQNGFASDTDGSRSTSRKKSEGIERSGRRNFSQQEERRNTSQRNSGLYGFSRNASYTDGCELQRKRFPTKDSERRRENKDGRFKEHTSNSRFSLSAERWKDFPTVSPVCGRNDGLPFDVDSLTLPFSKWRQESVKAYGNAIVPQVAYEIFQAINESIK